MKQRKPAIAAALGAALLLAGCAEIANKVAWKDSHLVEDEDVDVWGASGLTPPGACAWLQVMPRHAPCGSGGLYPQMARTFGNLKEAGLTPFEVAPFTSIPSGVSPGDFPRVQRAIQLGQAGLSPPQAAYAANMDWSLARAKAAMQREGMPAGPVPAMERTAGDGASSSRLAGTIFTIGEYVLVYPTDPIGNPEMQPILRRGKTQARFLRSDDPDLAVMTLLDHGKTVWIDPHRVTAPSGWTLTALLDGADRSKTTNPYGSMAGGPFHVAGRRVIGCREPTVVLALNASDARERIGPDNFQAIFAQQQCADLPDGLVVKVEYAYPQLAIVVTDPGGWIFSVPPRNHRGSPSSSEPAVHPGRLTSRYKKDDTSMSDKSPIPFEALQARLDELQLRCKILSGALRGAVSQLNPNAQVVARRHANSAVLMHCPPGQRPYRLKILMEVFPEARDRSKDDDFIGSSDI